MRATFVIEHFYPAIGGLEHSTQRLACEIAARGHEVTVITKQLPNTESNERIAQVTIRRLSDDQGGFCRKASELGLLDGADFIGLFGVGHRCDFRSGLAVLEHVSTAAVGLKVATEGDLIGKGIPIETFRRFHFIFCQNGAIQREALSIGVAGESIVPVINGLYLQAWAAALPSRNAARRALGLADGDFVVAGIGRFVRRKRFPLLIEAFRQSVGKACSRATLVLHGSGFGQHDSDEQAIGQLVASTPGRVRLLGPEHRTAITLSAADVFVTLGEREGAPNIILEALAAGVPVVVNDISGHRVYVSDGVEGLVVAESSPKAIGRALERMMDTKLRNVMAANGRSKAKDFDISRAADMYLDPILRNRCRGQPQ